MHLYRVMANVRAGDGQPKCARGQLGLVTVWVQSASEDDALERARRVIAERHYQSVEELTTYREQSAQLPGATGPVGDAAGYLTIRQEAMEHGDGLFELWYPDETQRAAH